MKPSALNGLLSCFPYAGLMMRIVSKFKYSFVQDLTNTLIELMISTSNYPMLFKHQWVIVPVPLHKSRQRWRGFNQAEVLAEGLSKVWDWPHLRNLLIRKKITEPQMKLSGSKRKGNLRDVFEINKKIVLPKRVLLIDDVATTCSTLIECARMLKRAGVKEVWGLTLAQTIPK